MENNINFNADENINIVEAKPEDKKSKKLPVIIIICVLVIALVTGIIIYVTKDDGGKVDVNEGLSVSDETTTNNAQKDWLDSIMDETVVDKEGNIVDRDEYAQQIQQQIQEATTLLNQYVGSESPNVIVENTTTANNNQQTESTTVNEQNKEKALEQIKAFFNRSFYIQGAIYSDNEGNALSMSFDGNNFEALTNLDGVEISVMSVDGVMYFKRPALGQYVEITDSVMELMGMSPEMLNFNFPVDSYDVMESKLVSIHSVEINGNEGICYEYNNKGQVSKFFFDGSDLRQIEIYDADGSIVYQFTIDYFSQSLPSDHLTLKGYEKTGFGSLFADILAEES